jgi:hypothetical protein
LPPYDFALFAPRVAVAADGDEDSTLPSGRERRDIPPRQDMVF